MPTVTISRDLLDTALKRVSRTVPTRESIPILSHVLLRVDRDCLFVTGTDLVVMVTARAEASASGAGRITVAFDLLAKIVGAFPSGSQVQLAWPEQNAKQVEAKCGRSRYRLNALPAEDFPEFPPLDVTNELVISSVALRSTLEKLTPCISAEETRFYLCGVYLHAVGERLIFVATDGVKLGRVTVEPEVPAPAFDGIIIPAGTVSELKRLSDSKAGTVTLRLAANAIEAMVDDVVIYSKLVDATYPDYERVIPQQNTNVALIDREDASAATSRALAIAEKTIKRDGKEGARSSALKLSLQAGQATISVSNGDAGDAEEVVEVQQEAEFDLATGFNGRFFSALLQSAGGKTTRLAFGSAGDPILLSAVGHEEADFVLMPMHV